MCCAPGAIRLKILLLAAVRIVNTAMQHQFLGTTFDSRQGHLPQQGDGIVIELPPACRIEVKKQARGIVVPTPPEIASQGPETLLGRSDEAIDSAGFAYHRGDLGGGLRQRPNFFLVKDPGLDGLHDENAFQNAAIDERNSEQRLVSVFTRFPEVFEAWMILSLLHGHRPNLFRHKSRETFVYCHAKSANTLRAKSERRG